jgi:signal peptidase II
MTTNPKFRLQGIMLASFIFIADQAVKFIMIGPLALESRRQIHILPFFNLTWAENRGVSMGFLEANSDAQRWMLVGLTALIAAIVAVWMWREKLRGDVLALSLVLGGALGNIVDRIRYGYVVDYADLHFGSFRPFYIFNLADACITIGVLILLARAFLMREREPVQETASQSGIVE